jgi:DUF971 family protein
VWKPALRLSTNPRECARHSSNSTLACLPTFRLVQNERVGTYAVQPVWADGHTMCNVTRYFVDRVTV